MSLEDDIRTVKESIEELPEGPGWMPFDLWQEDRVTMRDDAMRAFERILESLQQEEKNG